MVTAGARPISEWRKVTTLTARNIVDIPIANCLFFLRKSLTTYKKDA